MPTPDEQYVSVDGRRLKISSLAKVMYPATGTTKGDVLDYYARVADALVPHTRDRPATRKRWVHGVGTEDEPGQVFFQKNLDEGTPSWVLRRTIEHSDGPKDYPLVNDRATLAWFAQIASLEIHVPQWRFGPDGERRDPDRIVLDLDPGPGVGLAECAAVAFRARAILTDMGLSPFPVTSGSKGIHLYAALDGRQTSDQVSAVAKELARALEADDPDLVVSDMKKSLRQGRVLVDWSQNSGSKTTIAPYSLRGRLTPTVAAPRTWEELEDPALRHLDYREVLERVEDHGDLLAELERGDGADAPSRDRLSTYRSMRDGAKTPEPVPAEAPPPSEGRSFVIQEHHARRLHYDFRLEHDGVLVSWAIPKGPPTDPAQNHLAVQTEDHPLEYGSFEGVIPAGEYGAGEVFIWDRGTYDLEKWREGKEVIVTLHGEVHGTNKYALIRTGGRDGDAKDNWLIHLMKSGDGASSPRRDGSKEKKPPDAGAEATDGGRRAVGPTPRVRSQHAPMLASAGDRGEIGDAQEWAFEMKWDGIRALATVADGAFSLVTRNDIDVTGTYPDLAELVSAVDRAAVIDGEIVALNAAGRPDFGRLQQRMKLTRPRDVDAAARDVPVHFFAFDLLEYDGVSLLDEPYDERRRLLEENVRQVGRVHVPPAFDGDLDAALDVSGTLGLEGVMAKRRDARYVSGRRSRSWIKLKHTRMQEVVIAGWRPGQGNREGTIGSLLLGIPDDQGLRYVGKVGTGFGDKVLRDLQKQLAALETGENPLSDLPRLEGRDARFVRPELVGEVEFAEWTPQRKLRQPSWRGLRPDKRPDEVRVEA